ncbi:MAG: hypothetical protein ACP5P9_10245 [Acidimicrobiales bacterium]
MARISTGPVEVQKLVAEKIRRIAHGMGNFEKNRHWLLAVFDDRAAAEAAVALQSAGHVSQDEVWVLSGEQGITTLAPVDLLLADPVADGLLDDERNSVASRSLLA